MSCTQRTDRFRKKNSRYTKAEHNVYVKSNLIDFLQQLDIIDFDTWEELSGPIEQSKFDFMQLRGGFVAGKL